MTTFSINWRLASALLIFPCMLFAQRNLTGFWQSGAAVNYSVSQHYSHNLSLGYRAYVVNNENFELDGQRLDITHFSKWDLRDNQSIALGVQYIFREALDDQLNEFRLTEQYNYSTKPMAVHFGHRLRAEQRITSALTVHRFRYRFILDFPLSGEKLNLGETFFVAGFENLLSIANTLRPQYDTRLSGQVGWKFLHGGKMFIGLEYRLEDYNSPNPQNVLFLLTSAQLRL